MGLLQKDIAAIEATTEDAVQAVRDHDPDKYLKNCTDDIVFVPPGQSNAVGQHAVRSFLEAFPTPKRATYEYEEVEGNGDLAFARAVFTVTNEHDTATNFRAILIFRKQSDQSWKLARDIWTT